MSHRVCCAALSGALCLVALAGCSRGDSTGEVATLSAASCEELAHEFASELERRTMNAIADDERAPEAITEDVWGVLDATFRGLALATRGKMDCDPEAFTDQAMDQFSSDFRESAPRWLSSEDVKNTWDHYAFFVRDNIQEAIARESP